MYEECLRETFRGMSKGKHSGECLKENIQGECLREIFRGLSERGH